MTAKSAIVTGAGSGVGLQTAIQLAAAGYGVVLSGRTRSKLEQSARQIIAQTPQAELAVAAGDIGEPAVVRSAIDAALDAFGRIDAIAHVAGDAPLMPIDQVTPEIWRRCVDTNLAAAVYLASMAWPVFQKQRGGVIVNVSSLASVDPFLNFSIYAAAKVGVNMFTRCIAGEGEKIGVRAVTVAPGAIETPMLRALFDEKMLPTEKTLDPAAVAAVIVACITGQRAFEPGEVILLPSP